MSYLVEVTPADLPPFLVEDQDGTPSLVDNRAAALELGEAVASYYRMKSGRPVVIRVLDES